MSVSSVVISNVRYSVDDFFVIDSIGEDIPVFMRVRHILSFEGSWCLVGHLMNCDAYLRHYQCYTVFDASQWIAVTPGSETDYHYQLYN